MRAVLVIAFELSKEANNCRTLIPSQFAIATNQRTKRQTVIGRQSRLLLSTIAPDR